jgi:hypothetical protein
MEAEGARPPCATSSGHASYKKIQTPTHKQHVHVNTSHGCFPKSNGARRLEPTVPFVPDTFSVPDRKPAPPWVCLDWLSYFGRMRRAAQAEYRRQVDQMFGQVIRSPWEDLRHGLVLGGDALWDKVRGLIHEAQGDEEIRWRRRADADETSRMIESLVAQEADRRVAIWLRVRMGGERMTKVAADYGYRDGSGIHRVVQRLEKKAKDDRALARRLKTLTAKASSVNS